MSAFLQFSPLAILAASPRCLRDLANEVLYAIIDQLAIIEEVLVPDASLLSPLYIISRPKGPQRQYLVPRYSRSADATVIFYGEGRNKREVTGAFLQRHYVRLRDERLARHSKLPHYYDMSTKTWMPTNYGTESRAEHAARVQLHDVERQLVVVLDAWQRVIARLKRGTYYTSALLGRSDAAYCTDTLDVRLLTELDELALRDEEAQPLVGPSYEPIFVFVPPPPQKKGTRNRACDCDVCYQPARVPAMEAYRRMALEYHVNIDRPVFNRAFGDLRVCQPWPPRTTKTLGYNFKTLGRLLALS